MGGRGWLVGVSFNREVSIDFSNWSLVFISWRVCGCMMKLVVVCLKKFIRKLVFKYVDIELVFN